MSLRRRTMGQSGSEGIQLLASGTYEKTDNVKTSMSIPISFSGTPVAIMVHAPVPVDGVAQTRTWFRNYFIPDEADGLINEVWKARYRSASGSEGLGVPLGFELKEDTNILYCRQINNSYQIQENVYNWYIWGYKE